MAKHAYLPADALIAAINKQFGTNTLVRACDAKGLIKPRISTGSFALDLQLGGGYPEGAITILEGERTTSKSWTLHCMARNFLAAHPNAIYILINAEGTNDHLFLEMLLVDTKRTFILSPDSGEQAWDAAIFAAQHAQKVFIGADSLDAMVPLVEIEGDVGDAKYAPAAKMNNKGFRKLISAMKTDVTTTDQRVTFIVITQLREKIGVFFGDALASVGGRGKAFAAMTIIRFSRIKYLRTEGEKLIDKKTYGLQIEASIVKNKGWGEGEKVNFTLYKENHDGFRRGQIDNVTELVPYLLVYKIAEKAGAWITLGEDRYNGDADLAEQLRINDELREWCIVQVRESHAKRYEKQDEETATPAPAAEPVKTVKKGNALKNLKKGK